ncbi:MAG: lysozyme [Candidatus Methanomethylicota archaeon]|uniref:Lysozyme n=1 Tax=Thermoproteota archaeon TaxID=2056631 RepID=A0A497EY17_9CREN|nr:MAG: lysozyme [Candidatus Verstraetearchaeota archaeon]
MITKELRKHVEQSEGLRLKLYKCTSGRLTIGYGHNIDDNGITLTIAKDMLEEDLQEAERSLFAAFPAYQMLSQPRIDALIDLTFNIGITKFKRFGYLHKALAMQDFETAAAELMDSKYARQVGNRAKINRDLILTGKR